MTGISKYFFVLQRESIWLKALIRRILNLPLEFRRAKNCGVRWYLR
jgi:hypothetical protein